MSDYGDMTLADAIAALRTRDEQLTQARTEWRVHEKAYFDLADAVCRSSTSPEDACRQAKETREALAAARNEVERLTREIERLKGAA